MAATRRTRATVASTEETTPEATPDATAPTPEVKAPEVMRDERGALYITLSDEEIVGRLASLTVSVTRIPSTGEVVLALRQAPEESLLAK